MCSITRLANGLKELSERKQKAPGLALSSEEWIRQLRELEECGSDASICQRCGELFFPDEGHSCGEE